MNDRGLKVLEQYELETVSVRRGRGSYICETDKGAEASVRFQGFGKKDGVSEPDTAQAERSGIRDGGYGAGK